MTKPIYIYILQAAGIKGMLRHPINTSLPGRRDTFPLSTLDRVTEVPPRQSRLQLSVDKITMSLAKKKKKKPEKVD